VEVLVVDVVVQLIVVNERAVVFLGLEVVVVFEFLLEIVVEVVVEVVVVEVVVILAVVVDGDNLGRSARLQIGSGRERFDREDLGGGGDGREGSIHEGGGHRKCRVCTEGQ